MPVRHQVDAAFGSRSLGLRGEIGPKTEVFSKEAVNEAVTLVETIKGEIVTGKKRVKD